MNRGRAVLSYLLKPSGIHRLGGLRFLHYYKAHPFFIVNLLRNSQSQIGQDVFVACQLGLWKKSSTTRYFVEFGATDGINLSNTYTLEKIFKWQGLLIEPARIWKDRLISNRSSSLDFRCVYSESGKKIEFNESRDAVYSTILHFSENDAHAKERTNGESYLVETVTLNDALTDHGAPVIIDYLSIDTEGSEFQILQSIDFNKWFFRVITVEHNYMPQRILINELLTEHGYKRVFENLSYMDDWYIKC